jgi:hypothetical protein
MRDKTGAYRVLVGRPDGKSRCIWDDTIKMDLQEVDVLDCTGSG